MSELFKNFYTPKKARTKRISSWDRSGGNIDGLTVNGGETVTLGDIKGPARINHFYVTSLSFDRHYYRKVLVRMYWDGEENPSVEVPLGDFFGIGHCKIRYFQSLLLCVNYGALQNPGFRTQGLNSYFPMPFFKSARIELVNEAETPVAGFWYHIDYEELDVLEPDTFTFHAQFNRENPCEAVLEGTDKNPDGSLHIHSGTNLTGKDNYVILNAEGKGNLAGYLLNIDNIYGGWYGEGDDMIFIDGDTWPPSLHGTGTEEIFGGGGSPDTEYSGPYTGYHLISNKDYSGKNSMYRFFVTDPIRFEKSIRATIEHGHANNLPNDYSSVAYWYQREPHKLFKIAPVEKRLPRVPPEYYELVEREMEIGNKAGNVLADAACDKKDLYTRLIVKMQEAFNEEDYKTVRAVMDEVQLLL